MHDNTQNHNVVRSALWSMFQRYVPSLLHIVATLIISRLILPSEFGEVALVMTFSQISIMIVSSGFGEGLMYKVNNTNTMYSTVFFFNVGIALVLYLTLYMSSPWIADYYGIPRLTILIKVIALNIIIYALTYVQRVRFQMSLDFQTLSIISLLAAIIGSFVGIIMAYKGFNVWSIVFLTLTQNTTELILLWIKSKWTPRFFFSYKELKRILPYSSKIFFNNCVQVIYDNIYSLVIGKVYNTKSLGYYNRMQTVLFYTTTNFVYSIESVFFPLLCKKKDSMDDIRNAYINIFRVVCFLAFPVLVFMSCMANPLIVIVLTEKWIGGVDILEVLSLAFLFVPILYINNSFLKICNKPNVLLYSNILRKIIGILILIVTSRFSIMVLCYGVVLYLFIDSFISMLCIWYYVGISLHKQVSALVNTLIINALLFTILHSVCKVVENIYVSFASGILLTIVLYFGVPFIFRMPEYNLFKEIVKKLRKR